MTLSAATSFQRANMRFEIKQWKARELRSNLLQGTQIARKRKKPLATERTKIVLRSWEQQKGEMPNLLRKTLNLG